MTKAKNRFVGFRTLHCKLQTSFLHCFAHPARINNPKKCFCSPLSLFIQAQETLCFQIPSSPSSLLLLTNRGASSISRLPSYNNWLCRKNFGAAESSGEGSRTECLNSKDSGTIGLHSRRDCQRLPDSGAASGL